MSGNQSNQLMNTICNITASPQEQQDQIFLQLDDVSLYELQQLQHDSKNINDYHNFSTVIKTCMSVILITWKAKQITGTVANILPNVNDFELEYNKMQTFLIYLSLDAKEEYKQIKLYTPYIIVLDITTYIIPENHNNANRHSTKSTK